MGLDEIEEWLDRHVELRRNVITMRTEYRWKDEELALTQYGLISCEELDTMTAREMNGMKRAVTLQYVNVRPPFGRYTVHRPHIASFCGTGNNEKFLNDPTGSRRWLAFKEVSMLGRQLVTRARRDEEPPDHF